VEDSQATVREVPRAGEESGATLSLSSADATAMSPGEALRMDEIARTRRIVAVMYGIAFPVGVALPFLGGDPSVKAALYAAIGLSVAATTWLLQLARKPELYTTPRLALIWGTCAVGVCVGCLFFGVFSVAEMVVVLGIYFISLGQSRSIALLLYLMQAGFHLGVGGLIVAGVVRDPGIFSSEHFATQPLVVSMVLVQIILLASFLLGRWSRQDTLATVIELDRAVRSIAQREVLLHEAHLDIDRALQVGRPGYMSGRIVGSFRLGAVLGRGSMGEVYEATRVESGEDAAVKLLSPEVRADPVYLARFLREAQIAASLDSPHVVRVLEIGNEGADVPYLAMERLRGHDLGHLLRDRPRLEAEEVVDLVAQVARGVDAAADAGIVHRDLKPQNLFLTEQSVDAGLWKILDFGVSKLADRGGTLTQGRLVGTPAYMPPEQAQGQEVDRRADIYALAAIAYRALTGHLPFHVHGGLPAVVYAVIHAMPRRPSELAPFAPAVDDVLMLGMAKQVGDRFATARELATALDEAVSGRLSPAVSESARRLEARHPWKQHPRA